MRSTSLRALIEPSVEGLGYELVDVELAGGGPNATLRVYIDSEAGIDLKDCETVSRQLSALLDVEDPIAGQYTLEVSSPGLDRPLVKRLDFERFAGELVKLKVLEPVLGRRNFTGQLLGLEGEQVLLEMDKERYAIPLDNIERARLVPQWRK